ncbi:MAG: glycerophosphoryl diester phosphodiesterase membrane domain-containing protein [Novosphingobium sp.]|nr:glycerophosphoryl diester phosphodiesterase membrane domain-containing protein [Novosphingobium sp.]
MALAGVFFLLPTLGLTLLVPPPEPLPDAGTEAMMAMMSDYYAAILPFVLPMVLFQAAGTLGLLTLLTDRSRPTVSEAIRLGVRGVFPYVLAQLIIGLGVGVVGGFILAIGAVTGVAAIAAIGAGAIFALVIYTLIRTSLVGPIIVVEGERSPVAALKRSWQLTQRNTARIGLFYLLVGIAILFVTMVISLVAGLLFALFGSAEVSRMADAVIQSGLSAVMALYFVSIIAAVHRQLAGLSPGEVSATFE